MLLFIIFAVVFFFMSKFFECWWFLIGYFAFYIYKISLVPFLYIKIKDVVSSFHSLFAGTYFKRIYGVYGYVGEYGQGKTIALSREFLRLKKKKLFHDPADYIFCSNYDLVDTEPFITLDDILALYRIAVSQGKGLIIFWDEIQNEYPENDRFFPPAFRTLLTQNRKNKGVRLLWSTQDYTRVNKNIRLMTTKVSELRCFFGRYMIERIYKRAVYEDYYATTDIMQRVKKRPNKTNIFIQYDKYRVVFNSFKMLDSAKKHLGL